MSQQPPGPGRGPGPNAGPGPNRAPSADNDGPPTSDDEQREQARKEAEQYLKEVDESDMGGELPPALRARHAYKTAREIHTEIEKRARQAAAMRDVSAMTLRILQGVAERRGFVEDTADELASALDSDGGDLDAASEREARGDGPGTARRPSPEGDHESEPPARRPATDAEPTERRRPSDTTTTANAEAGATARPRRSTDRARTASADGGSDGDESTDIADGESEIEIESNTDAADDADDANADREADADRDETAADEDGDN